METIYRVSKLIKNELSRERYAQTVKSELVRKYTVGSVNSTSKKCTVDEDWLQEFETKLRYVEQAINENRHELKKEGNVVRIDQVKKVSVDSIRHLAQHSNYITDTTENLTDIIPSKLYVSENYDNHLLYENRFLYTILVYSRDFVENRYADILRAVSDTEKGLDLDCEVKTENRCVKLSLNYAEECSNDNTAVDPQLKDSIDRIDNILETIVALQNKPLMKEAANMSPLELPIVATNIIKKDTNFQESYRLLDFIVSYRKKGYEIEQTRKEAKELSREGKEDLASIVVLLGGITNVEADDSRIQLEREYLEEKIKELSPDSAALLNDMQRLHEAESRKKDEVWAQKLNELTLTKNAEITALRAKYNEFEADDHIDAESFKRLTEEKKALDAYYKKRWSLIKKKARKEYIWDRLKKK